MGKQFVSRTAGLGLIILLLVSCSTPVPTSTPTRVPPTFTSAPPTDTPMPPTNTPRPPTPTPEPTATFTPEAIATVPTEELLTVAAVTMNAAVDTQQNLETFAAYMEQAAAQGAHLIAFPEIALQQNPGWGPHDYEPTEDELAYVRDTAELIPGPSIEWLTRKAAELGIYVVFGMTELGEDGELYNASVFLGPEGVLGVHRKAALAATTLNESHFWATGDADWTVVESPIGSVGLVICVELLGGYGPAMAEAGADLLVSIAGWPNNQRDSYKDAVWRHALQASRWHVVANQTGVVGHGSDCGSSRIYDPSGNLIADTGREEGIVIAQTSLVLSPSAEAP